MLRSKIEALEVFKKYYSYGWKNQPSKIICSVKEDNARYWSRNVSPIRAIFINILYPTHLNPTMLHYMRTTHQGNNKCYVGEFGIILEIVGKLSSHQITSSTKTDETLYKSWKGQGPLYGDDECACVCLIYKYLNFWVKRVYCKICIDMCQQLQSYESFLLLYAEKMLLILFI